MVGKRDQTGRIDHRLAAAWGVKTQGVFILLQDIQESFRDFPMSRVRKSGVDIGSEQWKIARAVAGAVP